MLLVSYLRPVPNSRSCRFTHFLLTPLQFQLLTFRASILVELICVLTYGVREGPSLIVSRVHVQLVPFAEDFSVPLDFPDPLVENQLTPCQGVFPDSLFLVSVPVN